MAVTIMITPLGNDTMLGWETLIVKMVCCCTKWCMFQYWGHDGWRKFQYVIIVRFVTIIFYHRSYFLFQSIRDHLGRIWINHLCWPRGIAWCTWGGWLLYYYRFIKITPKLYFTNILIHVEWIWVRIINHEITHTIHRSSQKNQRLRRIVGIASTSWWHQCIGGENKQPSSFGSELTRVASWVASWCRRRSPCTSWRSVWYHGFDR